MVPVLPLIDCLILAGTASLGVGFILKSVALTTTYHPTVLGFSSTDCALIALVCLGLALVLAARTWVKLNEPRLLALERARRRVGAIAEGEVDWPRAPAGNGSREGTGEAPLEDAPAQARGARVR